MARAEHLPIYRASFDFAVWIEKTVRGFPRYHKYTIGTDLRNLSRRVLTLISRANSTQDRLPLLLDIREALEEMKVVIRLGKEVETFSSFKSFQYACEQVVAIARQNEGWIKQTRASGHGQNRAETAQAVADPRAP